MNSINAHQVQVGSVDLYDESHGVFGELIDPATVLQAIHLSDNVGQLDDPTSASAICALRSLTRLPDIHTSTSIPSNIEDLDIVVQFDNATNFSLSICLMDEQGKVAQQSIVDSFSSAIQLARPGSLFILTTASTSNGSSSELLIGAYRTLQALPSKSPHNILIEEEEGKNSIVGGGATKSHFFLENVLASDDTEQDDLMVAGAMLDPVAVQHHDTDRSCSSNTKTLASLSQIVTNLLQHPENQKFRTLRLSNAKLRHEILVSRGACYLLRHILCFGNGEDDDHWTVSEERARSMTKRLERTSALLRQLQCRAAPDFVEELEPPAPWQSPVLVAASSRTTNWLHNTDYSTHFLTPDERWARTERRRRGGAHRAFGPGNAPSSNGRWGR